MSWTKPHRWIPNEPITAEKLNTYTDAILELQGRGIWPIYRSGRWYWGLAWVSTTVPANLLIVSPFPVWVEGEWDRIGAYHTGSATVRVRLGVYEDTGEIYPGRLLVEAEEIERVGSGEAVAEISAELNPGLYWLVMLTNTSTTWVGKLPGWPEGQIGTSDAGGVTGIFWRTPYTYGPLPPTFPEGATSGVGYPVVGMRRK